MKTPAQFGTNLEFWGLLLDMRLSQELEYADYDWVAFAQIFGTGRLEKRFRAEGLPDKPRDIGNCGGLLKRILNRKGEHQRAC